MNLKSGAAVVAASVLTIATGSAIGQHAATQSKPQDPAPKRTEARDAGDKMQCVVRRATKLIDCNIKDTKGAKIGEVEDLIIDREEGYVAYAVLSFGGFLGVGEKLFAIPFTSVKRSSDDSCLVVDMTKAQLEKAPSFTGDNWPTFDRKYGTTVCEYYKATPYWSEPTGTDHGASGAKGEDPARLGKDALDESHLRPRGMCRASKAIGSDVEDKTGKNLGDVEEIIVDDPSGRVVYAVLSFGGVMGMGDKLFALPWQSLTRSPKDDDKLVLDVPKEKLSAAPGFDKKSWPDMADQRWGLDIHKYYGQQPHGAGSKAAGAPSPGSR